MIKTVIVDDEHIARERVQGLLTSDPDFTVVGQYENGLEALEALNQGEADLMFLDVQMPKLDGMELVRSLKPEDRPLIIFVTAYDQFAIEAFELFAIDYLLKPFSKERFRHTLKRVKQLHNNQVIGYSQSSQITGLLSGQELNIEKEPVRNKMSIKLGNRIYFIAISEIVYVCASGNYLEIFAEGKLHVIRETMSGILKKLPENFIRIHKSSIVNIEFVLELIAIGYGDYELKMSNGKVLRVSDTFKPNLLSRLGVK